MTTAGTLPPAAPGTDRATTMHRGFREPHSSLPSQEGSRVRVQRAGREWARGCDPPGRPQGQHRGRAVRGPPGPATAWRGKARTGAKDRRGWVGHGMHRRRRGRAGAGRAPRRGAGQEGQAGVGRGEARQAPRPGVAWDAKVRHTRGLAPRGEASTEARLDWVGRGTAWKGEASAQAGGGSARLRRARRGEARTQACQGDAGRREATRGGHRGEHRGAAGIGGARRTWARQGEASTEARARRCKQTRG